MAGPAARRTAIATLPLNCGRAASHDGEVAQDDDTGWAGYYAWSSGREPRPLLLAACQELGDGAGRMAIDLGCGEGTDVLELLARGWTVTAVDAEPAGLASLQARVPAPATERVQIVCGSFTQVDLPRAYLIHAGFSLPFCPPPDFPALWAHIRRALVPGGIFAGQLFGTRDSWADDPSMTFHTRQDVQALLTGLQILRLHESERDGQAFSGPKHWHTFDILARNPGQQPPPESPGH
jgi:SAM-dependent methyltransferase